MKQLSSALEQGILKVGIGKYGSEAISEDLEKPIIEEIENPDTPVIQKGAFLGALFLKGFQSNAEKKIQTHFGIYNAEDIIKKFVKTKSNEILVLINKLLNQETLTKEEAYIIGKFLFDSNLTKEEEFDIGLITTIFRFRYETVEEYSGLLKAIEELYFSNWNSKISSEISKKFVVITEPFDGVTRSYLFTPLIGRTIVEKGLIPFFIVSKNPGPKFHYNLYDLAKEYQAPFINDPEEIERKWNLYLKEDMDFHGFYIDLKDLSTVFELWINRRKLIKKRPFLATLERILNPINAKIQIYSAFHPPYLEKTAEVLENKKIPFIIGIRRGEEGGLTFSFNKKNEVLISCINNSSYQREIKTFYEPNIEKFEIQPDIKINIQLIQDYIKSHNISLNLNEKNYFLKQIKKTLEVYDYAISKIIN